MSHRVCCWIGPYVNPVQSTECSLEGLYMGKDQVSRNSDFITY